MIKAGDFEIVTVGDILKDEFLVPMGISQYKLARGQGGVGYTTLERCYKSRPPSPNRCRVAKFKCIKHYTPQTSISRSPPRSVRS
jgi:hypothetical protein